MDKKVFSHILVLVIITFAIASFGMEYFNAKLRETSEIKQSQQNDSINLDTTKIKILPTSWYSIPSKKCNMSFLVPNDSIEVKGLTENEILRILDWNATLSLVKDNYQVSVEVLCSPNDKNFTTDSLVARIEEIVAGNSQSQNRRIPSMILSKTKSNKWGREVYVLIYEAGDFQDFYEGNNYIFATKSNVYSVRIVDKLSDPETSEIIQQVFEKLEFN